MNRYSDVAAWASARGLGDYNNIIDLMQTNRMIPGYESSTWEVYKGVGNDYGYCNELSDILDAYASEFGSTEILIV